MKFRYYLLLLLVATGVTAGVWQWLSLPIWHATVTETIQYSGKNPAQKELYSLIRENGGQLWSLETRDYRTGEIKQKLKLEISTKAIERHNFFVSDTQDIVDSILVHVVRSDFMPEASRTTLLDGATGRQLTHLDISQAVSDSCLARHLQSLALALKKEVRIYQNKNDIGRSIPLSGISRIVYSTDGTWLACIDEEQSLLLINGESGEITRPVGIESKENNVAYVRFLSNGYLLTFSYLKKAGTISRSGVIVSRWQWDGKLLRHIGEQAVLRCPELLNMPSEVIVDETGNGNVTIKMFQGLGYPEGLESMFFWLNRLGVPVVRLLAMKPFIMCFELDSQNREVNRYRNWTNNS